MFSTTTLPNGLRIATESMQGVESLALSISVDVGARYERDAECGLSHMLEHMAFKGTTTRSARDIAEQFEAIGGHFNAYTSLEHTVYYAKVLAEHAPIAVDILTDILTASTLQADELIREQEVIVQEIGMHKDTPEDMLTELFDAAAFPDQPMGRCILGTAPQVMAVTRETLAAYQAAHYRPSRMVVSAAGKLTHDALVDAFAVRMGGMTSAPPHSAVPARYVGGMTHHKKPLEQTHVLLGMEGLPATHDDVYALGLCVSILGGGMASRLFQELREKRGLVYHVSAQTSAYADTGMVSMYAATAHAQARSVAAMMLEELARLARDVTPEELARAKAQQRAELVMSRENPGTVAGWIGRHLLVHGRYRPLAELLARIDAVTPEVVGRLAGTLATQPQTLALLGGCA